MLKRSIPPKVRAEVVLRSNRRCALCVFIYNNLREQRGQIAHINGDYSDNHAENLVWLCVNHYDLFDSTIQATQQNFSQIEVRRYRDRLHHLYATLKFSDIEVALIQRYLRENQRVFSCIFEKYTDLAFKIDRNIVEDLARFRASWLTSELRSFNAVLREIQDDIAEHMTALHGIYIYDLDIYHSLGQFIRLDVRRCHHVVVAEKRLRVKIHADILADLYRRLEEVAARQAPKSIYGLPNSITASQ